MDEQLACDKYRLLFELWRSENPIKTSKLQMLMATNSILASAFFLAGQIPWIPLVGFVFSTVWTFSIGRTVAFQHHWFAQMESVRKEYPDNELFHIHKADVRAPFWGSVSSRYYLIGTPIVTALAWLVVFLYTLLA